MRRCLAGLLALCLTVVWTPSFAGGTTAPTPAPTAYSISSPLPAGLGWNSAIYTPIISYTQDPIAPQGSVGISAKGLFGDASAACTSPAVLYYTASNGSDSNNGLTSGAPFATLGKAAAAATAGAFASFEDIVAPGTYPRSGTFSTGAIAADGCYMANGGRVFTGDFDLYAAPGASGSHSYLITTTSSVQTALDLAHTDQFGNYIQCTPGASAAQVDADAGQYCSYFFLPGTGLYVHRADGLAVTNANTMMLRTSSSVVKLTNCINLYIGGVDAASGFDMYGGGNAPVQAVPATACASEHAVVLENDTLNNAGTPPGGGNTLGDGNGLSVIAWKGIVACFNCSSHGNTDDCFNNHDQFFGENVHPYMLIVNSFCGPTGFGGVSDNCFTGHEDTVSLAVGLICWGNHGGTIRFINSAKYMAVGGSVHFDFGDLIYGGAEPCTAIESDNLATGWIDNVRIDEPGACRTIATAVGLVGAPTLNAGGSGYAAGDALVLANGAAIVVNSVSSGAIVTFVQTEQPTTQPSNPVGQSSTTGAGAGATFNYSYTNQAAVVNYRNMTPFRAAPSGGGVAQTY